MKTDAADLRLLLENPIFLSAFFSLLIAQFIKAVIALVKAQRSEDCLLYTSDAADE